MTDTQAQQAETPTPTYAERLREAFDGFTNSVRARGQAQAAVADDEAEVAARTASLEAAQSALSQAMATVQPTIDASLAARDALVGVLNEYA
ncbi:hypothetical protein [Candidatus Poriferisocius sp.]|uniref:hypothetical protein n=1 Tax=Candidatus Poriferisocius sp. TaxID=3101276 RepID=UPI003B52C873